MKIETQNFGTTKEGKQAQLFTLTNNNNISAAITDYGAKLVQLNALDNKNNIDDIVLGFDDVSGYQSEKDQNFGATIGPVAGRIGGAQFELEGKTHKLDDNKGGLTLHSGDSDTLRDFLWQAQTQETEAGAQIKLNAAHKEGQAGFPGNVEVVLKYTLTNDNSLVLEYEANTDKPTPICLTNHSYFNLAGHGAGTIKNHLLQIAGSRYTPWGEDFLPTGKIEPVDNSFLDFKKYKAIGADLPQANSQPTGGYDHYFILDKPEGKFGFAASVICPDTGRLMEVFTDQPGIVFYSGNNLESDTCKAGKKYHKQAALCLETQGYPGALNNPNFPSIILKPGQTYRQKTIYRFSAIAS